MGVRVIARFFEWFKTKGGVDKTIIVFVFIISAYFIGSTIKRLVLWL